MKVGRKIRIIREIKGYSQEYMSIQLEIAQATYSRIETDNTRVDIQKLELIAGLLDIDLISLLAFDETRINNYIIGSYKQGINTQVDKYEYYKNRVIKLEERIDTIQKFIDQHSVGTCDR